MNYRYIHLFCLLLLKTRDLVIIWDSVALLYWFRVLCWILSLCSLVPVPDWLLVVTEHIVEFSVSDGKMSQCVIFALSEVQLDVTVEAFAPFRKGSA